MSIVVEAYDSKNVRAAIEIWNEVVRDGIAFPQEDELDEATGDEFLNRSRSRVLPSTRTRAKFLRCTFFTRTTSGVAGTSATQVTPSVQICAGDISAN